MCNTEYIIGDLSLFKHYNLNPSALKGMMMEKVHAFSKLYPSRAKYIEKFGYDPKQLHHIIRLYDILQKNVNVYKYTDGEKGYMLDIKRGRQPATLEDAEKLKDAYIAKLSIVYDERKITYKPQEVDYDLLDGLVMEYLERQ